MKEQNEHNKARKILALTEAIVLALLLSYMYFSDTCRMTSIAILAIAVVLSAIIIICRWPLKNEYSAAENALDAVISIVFFAVSAYALYTAL